MQDRCCAWRCRRIQNKHISNLLKRQLMKKLCLVLSLFLSFFVTQAQVILLPQESLWKYLDNGSDQGSAWRTTSFSDNSWRTGRARLGYGDAVNTTVSYGTSSSSKHITTYFRTTFNIADPSAYSAINIAITRDDGAAVYVNGSEVLRTNLPANAGYRTVASSTVDGSAETTWYNYTVPTSRFVQGTNLVAVEVHQRSVSSSDMGFDLRITGVVPGMANIVRGAYLTFSGPSSVTVQWRTDVPANSEVRVGLTATSLSSYATDAAPVTDHTVQLTGLSPSTKYYYSIGSIGLPAQGDASNFFWTGPSVGSATPVRFWVTGDFGQGSSIQRQVRDAYAAYSAGMVTNGWLWLGDNAYANGTDAEYQTKVFNQYPTQFKQIPVFPCPGNHDYAQSGYLSSASRGTNFPYFSIFSISSNSGTEKYYSYNYGNIHFVSLDSYGSYNAPGSAMYNWLQTDLASNTQRWTVVYWHHAPYTKGSHNSDTSTELRDMRSNIVPLLEQYGVDLVLCGHSHIYERSKFINGHYGLESSFSQSQHVVQNVSGTYPNYFSKTDKRGTVYVVCGVSGEVNGTTASGYPHNAMEYSSTSTAGSLVLEVAGNRLDCKYLTTSGSIPDQFTIIKSQVPSIQKESRPKPSSILLYPNPANAVVSFIPPMELHSAEIVVVNMSGTVYRKLTYERIHDGEIVSIDLSGFPVGAYSVVVSSDELNDVKTMVVE